MAPRLAVPLGLLAMLAVVAAAQAASDTNLGTLVVHREALHLDQHIDTDNKQRVLLATAAVGGGRNTGRESGGSTRAGGASAGASGRASAPGRVGRKLLAQAGL